MESSKLREKPLSPAKVDKESIAFGVMYCPRARVKRTEDLNYDNRLLRQLEDELTNTHNYVEDFSLQDKGLEMGFVKDRAGK